MRAGDGGRSLFPIRSGRLHVKKQIVTVNGRDRKAKANSDAEPKEDRDLAGRSGSAHSSPREVLNDRRSRHLMQMEHLSVAEMLCIGKRRLLDENCNRITEILWQTERADRRRRSKEAAAEWDDLLD
jgi:hypothetical protein